MTNPQPSDDLHTAIPEPKKFIVPRDKYRQVRIAPHRFGQIGNMVVFTDPNGDRIDIYLTDSQLRKLGREITLRLNSKDA